GWSGPADPHSQKLCTKKGRKFKGLPPRSEPIGRCGFPASVDGFFAIGVPRMHLSIVSLRRQTAPPDESGRVGGQPNFSAAGVPQEGCALRTARWIYIAGR